MNHHHNTTNETGQQLQQFEAKAKNQDERVLEVFRQQIRSLTPSEVLEIEFSDGTPLTSVRRAFSNLKNRGALVRTDQTATGPYGRPEHKWELNNARR